MTLRKLLSSIESENILSSLENVFYSGSRKVFKDDLYHWYEYLIRKLKSSKKKSSNREIQVSKISYGAIVYNTHNFVTSLDYPKGYRVILKSSAKSCHGAIEPYLQDGIHYSIDLGLPDYPACPSRACWYCEFRRTASAMGRKNSWEDLANAKIERFVDRDLAAACILHEIASLGFKDGKITI